MRSTTPITLVLSTKTSPPRRWSKTSGDGSRVVVIRDIAILCEAIAALEEFENYLDRIIIDHAATDGELLAMLNRLSPAFRGEVLIASDEWASLSVWNDQGRRTLQNLSARDVGSYLRRYDLTVHLEQLAVA